MSEPVVAPVQISAEPPKAEVPNVVNDPFAMNAWSENQPEIKKEEIAPTLPEIKTEIPNVVETKTVDSATEPFYKKLGFEKEDDVINEITVLREKNAKVPEEIKFENEESKTIHELLRAGKKKDVLQILALQDKLETLATSEVDDNNAADIIKTGLKLKFKDLSDKEIEYKYNQQYKLPKEPQGDLEDDDFKATHEEWKEQVDNIKMNKIIDAKTMKPDLAKAKTELVFPEIEKPKVEAANEPDPAVIKQIRDNFLNKLESDYVKADGFLTKVKDESVEIPVAFKIPDEDKIAIKKVLENNFDVDQYISSRWFGEKGEPRIEQIVSDIYLLDNLDKVLSGIANNSANQRLVQFRKETANIDVSGNTHQNTFQPNADGKANISPFAKEAWSEKQPVLQS